MSRPSTFRRLLLTLPLLALARAAPAQTAPSGPADLDFLREEGAVTSASRRARELSRAPATVYVVTARQLRESGAQTLWDALRGVPGVDVVTTRSMQGEVSVRGLDGPLNNRTLVLLDGKTVLNGFFDFMVWESLPVSLDEIDRVEIVEGPASALYGPNAVNGVINIITKRPEAVGRASASLTAGEDGLLFGSAMTGDRKGPWAYKLDLGDRQAGRFFQPGLASRASFAHGLVSRDVGEDGSVELAAGINEHDTRFSASTVGEPMDDGTTGFVRGGWRRGLTKLQTFWNYGRTTFREVSPETPLDYDTYDVQLEQGFDLVESHEAVVGAEYRRNASRSSLYGPGSPGHSQDLWAAFAEDDWALTDALSLDLNARLDHHPLAGYRFSPRGSLVWTPLAQQTLRASVGSAFRDPTLVENYVDLTQTAGGASFTRLGQGGVRPERAAQYELAYVGQFERARARASVFRYRLDHLISFTQAQLVSASPPSFLVPAQNRGQVLAWGGEASLESPLGAGVTGSVGWSYELLKDEDDAQEDAESAPRNKVAGAVTWRGAGWTVWTQAFWQARTRWRSNPVIQPFVESESLPDYWLLNARVGYAFSGRLTGLEAAVSAWNLLERRHSELTRFQNGVLLGRRAAGTLSWRFE